MSDRESGLVSDKAIRGISSRSDLATFVHQLARECKSNGGQWENTTLPTFLEAMGAWIEDMPGYYEFRGQAVPEAPSWQTFAEILAAARTYE
jgi:hypothetical protein